MLMPYIRFHCTHSSNSRRFSVSPTLPVKCSAIRIVLTKNVECVQ
jgi:hypothetical protein